LGEGIVGTGKYQYGKLQKKPLLGIIGNIGPLLLEKPHHEYDKRG